MSTILITRGIWPHLTAAVRSAQQPCAVAVAYVGAGASRRLPLPRNSRLVVNAGERAVELGQTCPDDLIRLVNRGVKVYSVTNLHAKVFVVGRAAYIGSANVSRNSATDLVEAVVRTTDPKVVQAARQFVREHCLHELTPTVLRRLSRLYRPPKFPGGKRVPRRLKDSSRRPTLPRLQLAQLELESWSERDQRLHDTAMTVARKRHEHPRTFELNSFRQTGRCPYKRGDVVVQVLDEGRGRVLVAPPGNVLHVRTVRRTNRQVSFVYLERPARRRRQVKVMARALGRGALKKLRRNGVVRDAAFAQAVLGAWT